MASFHTFQPSWRPEQRDYRPVEPVDEASSRYTSRADEARTNEIHILGTGSIGKLVAHSLRGLPNPPPVTLLLHKGSLYTEWVEGRKEITLVTKGTSVSHGGFNAELARAGFRMHQRAVGLEEVLEERQAGDIAPHLRRAHGSEDIAVPDIGNEGYIQNLIVTAKAGNTVGALLSVKHRLGPTSSILFLQNGLGVIEEVNQKVFPDPGTRPTYLQGVISHGVNSSESWTAIHAGQGSISISILPREDRSEYKASPESARYLLRTVCRSPVLAAIGDQPTELLQKQLSKLAVNCVINPLTTMIDARNGAIFNNKALERTMRLLLMEISLVIRNLPELQALPNTSRRFSVDTLYRSVYMTANQTAENISSTLADVRNGNRTEIDYLNGYIVKRGEELGIKCFMNYMMQQMVKGKRMVVRKELLSELPLTDPKNKKADPYDVNRGQDIEDIEDGDVDPVSYADRYRPMVRNHS